MVKVSIMGLPKMLSSFPDLFSKKSRDENTRILIVLQYSWVSFGVILNERKENNKKYCKQLVKSIEKCTSCENHCHLDRSQTVSIYLSQMSLDNLVRRASF